MARKPRPHSDLIPIATWQEADEVLKTIGSLQLKVAAAEADAAGQIADIKSELKDSTDPMLADIARMVQSLEAYCANHQDDFGQARSRQLQFGTVGWRASTSISAGPTCIDKIKAFFGRKAFTYLRVKVEPNKETLEKLDDAILKKVGVKRIYKDPFFAEPELPQAVDY